MDLDIDEVSLVDRGANQHSLVAFSKSLDEASTMEDSMSVDVAVYSETGEEVDVDTLEHGDTVFDAEGGVVELARDVYRGDRTEFEVTAPVEGQEA